MTNPAIAGLARRLQPGLFADPVVYARVASDLAAIGATSKELGSQSTRALQLRLDFETWSALQSGSDAALDCELASLGVRAITLWEGCEVLAELHPAAGGVAVARQLRAHKGVIEARSDSMFAMGEAEDQVAVAAEGDLNHYVLRTGSGDCPSGCGTVECRHYLVRPGGVPESLGSWSWEGGVPKADWAKAFCHPKVDPRTRGEVSLDRLQVLPRGGSVSSPDGARTGAVHELMFELADPFRDCYAEAALDTPGITGDITLDWTVRSHVVSDVDVAENSTGSARLEDCLVTYVERRFKEARRIPEVDDGDIRWTWTFQVAATADAAQSGMLLVLSNPNATVVLDGVAAGETNPHWARELSVGRHEVTLTAGRRTTTQPVEIVYGHPTKLCWDLEHDAPCGQ